MGHTINGQIHDVMPYRMSQLVMLASMFFLVSLAPALSASRAQKRVTWVVVLDGIAVDVHWSDGDSFRVPRGPRKGFKSRITGFNTLESYGQVHRWGTWTPAELYDIARQATDMVRSGRWTCNTVVGKSGRPVKDHYGRHLLRCPDLGRALIEQGLAHAFFVDAQGADPALMKAQHAAQEARRGMWAKGVPVGIVTSVHSAGEQGLDQAYKRVVSTSTGVGRKVFHQDTYQPCSELCLDGSCLLYVPFNQRYGQRKASCLR